MVSIYREVMSFFFVVAWFGSFSGGVSFLGYAETC